MTAAWASLTVLLTIIVVVFVSCVVRTGSSTNGKHYR